MSEKKFAYLILAHADPNQLHRLVNALNYKCDFFIHIDLYSDLNQFVNSKTSSNVRFISNRVAVNWAGFSQVRASLNLIKAAINSGEEYSHLVLLSGMDYPIKPPQEIWNYFDANQDKQFIKIDYMEEKPDWYMPMFERYFFRDAFPIISNRAIRRIIRFGLEKVAKPFKRKFFPNIKPCAGSSWWAITSECARYIIDFTEQNRDFVGFYKNSFASDEQFYHTIVANSHFVNQIKFSNKTDRVGVHEFANLHIVHPSLKYTYTIDDLEEIKKSDKFFVRKVNSKESKELLDAIDAELLPSSHVTI